MKYFLFAAAACIVLFQCKKSAFNDLSGPATLKGVAVIYDTLTGLTLATPLKNAKVFLRYDDNPNSFLYSTTSNGSGQYKFSGINLDRSYVIYSSVDTGAVKYEGQLKYAANGFSDSQSDSLKLYPASGNQNGIHLIVQDSVGGRLYNITAWVFNSPVLFTSDTSAGRVFDMTTNFYGVANKYNVAPDKYYFRVKTKIGNLELTAEDSVQVTATGIKTLALTLRRKPLTRNGIELTVLDRFNTPVSGAVSYFYRSQSIFLADTVTYSQSIFKLTTNSAGLASTYVIDTARYYFRTIKVINADTLKKTDFVDVTTNIISKKTVTFQ
jgi:hypothetical protein